MTNHTSTQERLGAAAGTLRATCVSLLPLLLAALMVGCSTKATHLGSLSGDPTLAGNDTSKRRASSTPGGPANAATSGSSDSASASQGGAGDSREGVGAGQANDLAGNEPGASSSGDSAAGVAGGARAGGNRASTSGSKAGAAGAEASAAASSAAASQGGAGAAQTSAGDVAAAGGATAAGGRPGTKARGGASPTAGGDSAGGDSNAQGDAEGADLAQGDSTAALEGAAAGAAGRNRGGAAGASAAGGGAGGDTAAAIEGDGRIAAIDVPSGKVKVDEEYRPQTLGGALPLILGVNEEGRFDFDQYSLRPEVKHILDDLAAKLKTAEYDRLDIVGYTDRIGTTDYNRRLSELRAYAVAQYLMGKGVPQNKIHYEGRGDKNPLTPSADCQGLAREELITCLQKDRRVEIEASIHRKHATVLQ